MLQALALRAEIFLLPGPQTSCIQLAHLEAQQVLALGAVALGRRPGAPRPRTPLGAWREWPLRGRPAPPAPRSDRGSPAGDRPATRRWCSCWPCTSTRCSPSRSRSATVTGESLMKARCRPERDSSRRTTISPSSGGQTRLAQNVGGRALPGATANRPSTRRPASPGWRRLGRAPPAAGARRR